MNKNTIVLIILVTLVLVSLVQAVQLIGLKTTVSAGGIRASAQGVKVTANSPTQSGDVSVPSSIQNLPSMVGGC